MKKIRFKALALIIDGESEVSDTSKIKSLDGLKYDDEDSIFSEYMSDDGDATLKEAGISGGLMYFKFEPSAGTLFGFVEYDLERTLAASEVKKLQEYTIGQLTDGIGSNFEQERLMNNELLPVISYEEFQIECS